MSHGYSPEAEAYYAAKRQPRAYHWSRDCQPEGRRCENCGAVLPVVKQVKE